MSTFKQLLEEREALLFETETLEAMITTFESAFMGRDGEPPEHIITTEERQPVPEEVLAEMAQLVRDSLLTPRTNRLKKIEESTFGN